jgi:protein phosphatase
MGGHAGGEVASQLAVDTISNFLEPRLTHTSSGGLSPSDEEALLLESIQIGQQAILQTAETTPALQGMGTTVVLLRISPRPTPRLLLLHVGDSRGYLLRDGTMRRLALTGRGRVPPPAPCADQGTRNQTGQARPFQLSAGS